MNNKTFTEYERWFRYPIGDILKMIAVANEITDEENRQITNAQNKKQ